MDASRTEARGASEQVGFSRQMPSRGFSRGQARDPKFILSMSPKATPHGSLLVTPALGLPHQRAVLEIARRLDPFVREQQIGELFIAPVDVELDPWSLVQPDLFVAARIPAGKLSAWRATAGDILVAVEIISPSSMHADRHLKRRRYLRAGIPEYWAIDLNLRIVECWRPGDEAPAVLADQLVWSPPPEKSLEVSLGRLFEEIWR